MSEKKVSDKSSTYEPLKVETTTMKFSIKTTGDLITKEYDLIPFHPNMADMRDLSNNNYILFPSFVKITMNDLKRAGVGQDYMKVFTTIRLYIELIRYVTSSRREEDYSLIVDPSQIKNYSMGLAQNAVKSITESSDLVKSEITIQNYEPLSDEEIILNNILLLKSIFLPSNGRFYVLNREYVIGKSIYVPKYKSDGENPHITAKKIPMFYNATIELQLLDALTNPGIGNFGKLTCKAKKVSIKNDIREIFGTGIIGEEDDKKTTIPTLTPTVEMKRGFGKLQVEWEQRNKFVKPPETEKERIELLNKQTPLQKKMAKFDEHQKEYEKIPPLWVKTRKEIDSRYKEYDEQFKSFMVEKKKIEEELKEDNSNSFIQGQVDTIKGKISDLVNQMKTTISQIPGIDLPSIPDIITDDAFKTYSKALREKESKENDKKFTKELIDGITEKKKMMDDAKEDGEKIQKKLNALPPGDYSRASIAKELAQAQARYRKLRTDHEMLLSKYGKDGEKIINTWEGILNKMDNIKGEIENEKTSKEKEESSSIVRKELSEKKKDIDKAQEKLLLKEYYEGIYDNISKSTKEKYEKDKKLIPPTEEIDILDKALKERKEEYFAIANKLGSLNLALQEKISLRKEEEDKLKSLKGQKQEELNGYDKKISNFNNDIIQLRKVEGLELIQNTQGAKQEDIDKNNKERTEALKKLPKWNQIEGDKNMIQGKIDKIRLLLTYYIDPKLVLYGTYIDKLRGYMKNKDDSQTTIDKIKDNKDNFEKLLDELKNTTYVEIKKLDTDDNRKQELNKFQERDDYKKLIGSNDTAGGGGGVSVNNNNNNNNIFKASKKSYKLKIKKRKGNTKGKKKENRKTLHKRKLNYKNNNTLRKN